jgi:Effector-associated domain 1
VRTMGFLDERPFRFEDAKGRRLQGELMRVYSSNQAPVQQFVDGAGMHRAAIAWTGRMQDVWPEVLRTAAEQRLLRALMRQVAADADGAAIEVVGDLLAEPVSAGGGPGHPTDPYALNLLSGGRWPRPFIARPGLRELLREFTEEDTRVLIVTGDRRAGKSYSWHLINHVVDTVRGVRPGLLDLTKWSGPPMGPQDVMEMIADALGMDAPPRDPLAQDYAQTMRLAVWFLGQLRRRRELTWLVVDGLDRAAMSDSARRLIAHIVEGVQDNQAGDLRVALLEGPPPEPDAYGVLHDIIKPAEVGDLRELFDEASAIAGGGKLTDEAFDLMLAELFSGQPPDALCLEEVGPRAARLAGDVFLAGRR